MNKKGFTFIEVLVAMMIFMLAAMASVEVVKGAVLSTRIAKEMTTATWLVQKLMVEQESRLESLGFEKACVEKQQGRFDSPHEDYNYTINCHAIDYKISQTAAQMLGAGKSEQDSGGGVREDLILKSILNVANDYLNESLRELHVEVAWMSGQKVRTAALTTHVVRLDQKLKANFVTAGGG